MKKTAAVLALLLSFAYSITVYAQGVAPVPGRSIAMPPAETGPQSSTVAPPVSPVPGSPAAAGVIDYVLGVGDKLQIIVFGEEDLSGEFQISSTGTISLPLIGEVKAAGQTASQVQETIVQKLSSGYMRDPRVSLQVSTYRPFFIVGEVMKPGSYTYVNGMTVINAVALAGGYTYRADKDDIKLKHGGTQGQEQKAEENTAVVPGDVITVPERFF